MTDSAGADEPRPSREAAGWGPLPLFSVCVLSWDIVPGSICPAAKPDPPGGQSQGHALACIYNDE